MIAAAPLKINPDFKNLIPPLTSEEFKALEDNCISEGIRDSIVIWRGFIIDGHNRYDIATSNDLEYSTIEKYFDSEYEVRNWMINNQLGRRNLTKQQQSYLRGKRYNNEKKSHGGTRASHQNDDLKTRDKLASEYKVSAPTIERDAQYAKGVDSIAKQNPKLKDEILSGEAKIPKNAIQEISKIKTPDVGLFKNGDTFDFTSAEKVIIAANKAKVDRLGVHYSSDTPEWYTPPHIIDKVIDLFIDIDLDPCSNSMVNPSIPALKHFTKEENGLSKEWYGKVYMNPPYGRDISHWVDKVIQEYRAGRVTEAILLVPSRTDTKWFGKLNDYCFCFVRGRLKFSGVKNAAPFPNAVVYMGVNSNNFINHFSDIGGIFKKIG